ncbi:MAG: trypsin-like peptidase domain-containing protein [bacterium]|nr:trypsin-like peptidase domain-containing protein [bacterium]
MKLKKILSYLIIFVSGVSIGIFLWSKFRPEQSFPIFHSSGTEAGHVAARPLDSVSIRQVAIQELMNSRRTVITEAASKVGPAVVGINVIQIKEYRSPLFDDPFFRYFFPERGEQVVKGLGSGFIISSDGYIVTNEHVVHQAAQIVVTLPNGKKYEAESVASDYISDIALLKINANEPLPFVILGNSADLIIGEWAIAIGNPFGLFDMGQPSVSQGIISATDRDFGKQDDRRVYKDMIQTDSAINSGNSGGPLVNSLGEVIGINTFIFSGSDHAGTSIGLGFAIPINQAKKIIQELREHGGVNRKFKTGLEVENLTYSLARYLGLKNIEGVIISNIESSSPAERAELKVGDVVLEINDFKIQNTRDIWNVIENMDARGGDILTLKIYRKNRYLRASLRLEELK